MSSRSNKTLRLAAGGALIAGTTGVGALVAEQAGAVDSNMLLPQSTFTVSNTNDAGQGSLRQAVLDANANAGADTITFDPSVTGTITLTSGEISITDSLTITGPGAANLTVSGNDASRIFHATGAADVSVSSLTLSHGSTTGNGGAILFDYNASAELTDVIVSNSHGVSGGGVAGCTDGDITITDSQFVDNLATNFGGGLNLYCYRGGTTTISGSSVSGNQAGDGVTTTGFSNGSGGGFFITGSKAVDIHDTTIDGNSSVGVNGHWNRAYGGGGYIGAWGGAPATLRNVTVSNNSVSWGNSAGIELWSNSSAIVANSTFTGNSEDSHLATAGRGALGLNQAGGGGATFKVLQTTITGNETNASISGLSVSVNSTRPAPTVKLYGSIVAANSGAPDLGFPDAWPNQGAQVSSNFTLDSSHSLVGTIKATTPFTDNGGNLTGVSDPKLGPLANNGGSTKTMALLAGSPAIDAGGSTVPTFPGNQFDQRGPGFARLSGSALDIGAFEIQVPVLTAVAPASGPAAGGTTITLTGSGFGPGMTVTVGGAACTNVTVLSSTSATCVTPGGTAGVADVVVDVSGLTASKPAAFTFVADPTPVVPTFTG